MLLSAVMIARNEEAMIGAAIGSLRGFDEIVVLDTGSSDRTVEIASDAGATVHTGWRWRDDFAAARNEVTACATGDWVLSIDADWQLECHGDVVRAEAERVERLGGAAALCRAVHAPGFEHWLTVLYKRGAVQWVGPVHECLSAWTPHKTAVSFRIGNSPAKAGDPERNLRILLKSDLTKPRHQFYLGREYYERGVFDQAIAWLKVYLSNGQFLAEVAEAHLTIARCHWRLGHAEEARRACLMAITCNPDFAEALRFMAAMHTEPWRRKWLTLAAAAKNEDVLFVRAA